MPSLFSVIPCQYFFFHFVLFCEANTVLSFLCILHYNFTWNFYPALLTYFHWIQHTFLFPLRLLRLMDYLELHCLVSTCLEIVPLSFCNWFLVWVCVIRGYPLYDVNPFKSLEVCFMAQDMVSLGKWPLDIWRAGVLCFWAECCMFIRYHWLMVPSSSVPWVIF